MPSRINWDYVKAFKEPYLILKVSSLEEDKSLRNLKRVLIVNAGLVGDFMTSVPAIRTFIKNNKNLTVDLVVNPLVKSLAEKIKGVRNVFVAESYASRDAEKISMTNQKLDSYGQVRIMMIGDNSYNLIKNIRAGKINSSLAKFFKYQYYLVKNGLLNRKPVQKKEIYPDLLDEKMVDVKFEDMFDFDKEDYEKIKKLDMMKTKDKIVIIHTSPPWIMRKWNNAGWIELIKKINGFGKYRFIFVGAKNGEADFREISSKLDFKIYSLINKIGFSELIRIFRVSDYFIGVDSGPRNMAHLADLRSITLFGSAASGAIHMPFSKKDIVIDKSNGGGLLEVFFYKKNRFINRITPDEVFEAFKRLASKKN
jgi:ADP-heptose:LPS heptosyltransferase